MSREYRQRTSRPAGDAGILPVSASLKVRRSCREMMNERITDRSVATAEQNWSFEPKRQNGEKFSAAHCVALIPLFRTAPTGPFLRT